MNTAHSLAFTDSQSTDQTIERWLKEASIANSYNKREHTRYPFFRAVTVNIGVPHETEIFAFSRDISPNGIGLLHRVNLPSQQLNLTIQTIGGTFVTFQAELAWTKPYGNGWHLSGMRATDMSAAQSLSLLVDVFVKELKERWYQRTPFCHPATITLNGQCRRTLPALSRDISSNGIGLIHHVNVDAKNAVLRISINAGPQLGVSIECVWCRPSGPGVFLSGWKFWQPDIVELEPYCP